MVINLKQIRTIDTDNIKLDKINYNFDQLVINGGGPKGATGSVGSTGPQGFEGILGVQGSRGTQGTQGPDASSSESYWTVVPQVLSPGSTMATMFANNTINGTDPLFATVVKAGYIINEDNGYNTQQNNSCQWVVNRKRSKVASNLRFTSADVGGNAFDITMDNSVSSNYSLFLGFIDNQNSQLNFQAEQHIIRSTNTGFDLLKISTAGGEINVDTIFENPVEFNEKLSISNLNEPLELPALNKIVTAVDNNGLVTFKTSTELGGSVKIGTIISILPSIFTDSNNFVNFESIDSSISPDTPIEIRIGSGVGDYSGWYICNGQEWTDGGLISIQVPDLNSFSYQIVANPISVHPNSQGHISLDNDEIQLIGGADILINAIENGVSSALYDISLTDNSNDPQIATNSLSGHFKIKKLPQIIYLGTNDLYWSQLGTGQISGGDYSGADYNIVDYNAS